MNNEPLNALSKEKRNLKKRLIDFITKLILVLKAQLSLWFIIELVIVICLYLIFKSVIEAVGTTIFVEHLFSAVDKSEMVDVACIILASCMLILFIFPKRTINIRTSLKTCLWLIAISLVYFWIYRTNKDSPWLFTPFQFQYLSCLRYADILLLFTGLNFISWGYYICKLPEKIDSKKTVSNGGLIEDLALGKSKREKLDKLGYEPYATRISQLILDTFPEGSLAIGINGEWGSGKTSFMYLMEEAIKEKIKSDKMPFEIIHFNPWESSGTEFIVRDFFEQLSKSVSKNNKALLKKLFAYSKRLTHIDPSPISKLIGTLTQHQEPNVADLQSQIKDLLKTEGRRILIFIDDLDRLDSKELMQVLKLVRNSAGFSNIFFVLAYDRSNVNDTLQNKESNERSSFLEKIVQAEFNLPRIELNGLVDELKRNINEIIQEIDISEVDKSKLNDEIRDFFQVKQNGFENILLGQWIKNLRDVIRLSNSLKACLSKLAKEVFLPDLIYLELLKLKFPEVYRLFQKDSSNYLNENNNQLNLKSDFTDTPEIIKKLGLLQYNDDDKSRVSHLLAKVFRESNESPKFDRLKLSVVIPRNYHLYFRYYLDSADFSERDYIKAKKEELEKFKARISQWVGSGQEERIKERLGIEELMFMETQDEFEKILEATLFLAGLRSVKDPRYKIMMYSLRSQYWCLDVDKEVSAKFYDDGSKLKSKIREILTKKIGTDFSAQNSLVEGMKNLIQSNAPLFEKNKPLFNLNELSEISLELLQSTLEISDSFDVVIHNTLCSCKIPESENVDPKAIKKVWDFIKEKNQGHILLLSLIYEEKNHGLSNPFRLLNSWKLFFENKNDMISFVEDPKLEWKYKEDYSNFLKAFFESGEEKIIYPMPKELLEEYQKVTAIFYANL
jgi:hypothetical protein